MYFQRLNTHPDGDARCGEYKPHQQQRMPPPGSIAHDQGDQKENRSQNAKDEEDSLQVHKCRLKKLQAVINKGVTAFDPKESRQMCQDFLEQC